MRSSETIIKTEPLMRFFFFFPSKLEEMLQYDSICIQSLQDALKTNATSASYLLQFHQDISFAWQVF